MKVVIPNYLKRVKLSEARRAKYILFGSQIADKYKGERYCWRKRGKNLCLYDKQEGEFVIKNAKAAGTPSYQTIAGNEIYARMHERKRMMIVHALKDNFKEHIRNQISAISDDMFPLSIDMEIHVPFGYADWDLDNLWIYHKCFQDSLRDLKLIPDDNVLYVRDAGRTKFVPVMEDVTPTMIFNINKASGSSIVPKRSMLFVTESSEGEPGTIETGTSCATIYTGKSKVIFGAAKKAIHSVMLYALNNFFNVYVKRDVYNRYREFFEEVNYEKEVKIIIEEEWKS